MTIWYYTSNEQAENFCPSDPNPCGPFFSNKQALYLYLFDEIILEENRSEFCGEEIKTICKIIEEIENEKYGSANEFLEELDEYYIQKAELYDE